MSDHYAWLAWASAFLIPWAALFVFFPRIGQTMWRTSLYTMPFGLTEPLFVPEYWNPPSLFDLAQRTGFDLESLIFCFAIGGLASVAYDVLRNQRLISLDPTERAHPRHRLHYLTLLMPFMIFLALVFMPWNPIYPGIAAMIAGALATRCRPDIKNRTWVGGVLFLGIYVLFLQGLEFTQPGYIQRYWNLSSLTGISFLRMPLEELLFAAGFGLYWAGIYEHFTWRASTRHAGPRVPLPAP
ncbi:MAG: lycopene cyclase domain-containing protein [Verrucomicrobia bacterium]|nr:lycopene cyclase domain-containing protein [Verrucomicrobiota bacterium]